MYRMYNPERIKCNIVVRLTKLFYISYQDNHVAFTLFISSFSVDRQVGCCEHVLRMTLLCLGIPVAV